MSLGEKVGKGEPKFKPVVFEKMLQLHRREGNVLGGHQQFACETGFGGAAPQSFFSGNPHKVRVVVFLRYVRENEIPRDCVEAVGVGKIFAYGMIRKMPRAAEHTLLDDPGIRTDFQHVEVVIGFEHQAVRAAQMHFDKLGHVTEIGNDGHLCAVRTKSESEGVGGIVGNREGVHFDVANGEALAGVNRFDSSKTLSKRLGKNALHSSQRGLSNVKRRFPKAEHLRQAIAMVGVFVSDEDAVEMFDRSFNGGEAGKRFTFAESRVHEESGAPRLE
jgi:hypothetical protein